ncbi:MAG: right-handed parallel beta-helix repeat-containing protein [Candidatus Cloacimonetes bacterium]|nr:right-handed parallel beta-helix repeat-containing protein [Candidatus Cloacimonadota bacterium]
MSLFKKVCTYFCMVSPLMAMSYDVSNLEEFNAILKKLSSGDEVVFASGNYGKLNLNGQIKGSNEYIKLISKEHGQAEFTNVFLQNIKYLELDGFKISQTPNDYNYITPDPRDEGRKVWEDRSIVIANSEDISIKNCIISDMEDENHNNDHNGVTIRDSKFIVFEKNDLSHLYTAAIFQNVSNVQILQNYFHDIRNDGINIAGASKAILIEKNKFEDFFPHTVSVGRDSSTDKRDHADHIQIHSVKANERAEDITIKDNVSLMGQHGKATQSIFIQASADGSGIDNRNIKIIGNHVSNGHHHGISVFDALDVVIESNTVEQSTNMNDCKDLNSPGIHIRRVENATILDNTSTKYTLDQKSYLPQDNTVKKCGETKTETKSDSSKIDKKPVKAKKLQQKSNGFVPRSEFNDGELKAIDELFGY